MQLQKDDNISDTYAKSSMDFRLARRRKPSRVQRFAMGRVRKYGQKHQRMCHCARIALLEKLVKHVEDDHIVMSTSRHHGSSEGTSGGSRRRADGRRVNIRMTWEIKLDSSAALGVVAREGTGKLRHVNVASSGLQALAD